MRGPDSRPAPISGPRIVLELAAAAWAELNAGEETGAVHGETAARTEAGQLVAQKRDGRHGGHREIQHFGALGKRVGEGDEDESRSGEQGEMPALLALVRSARVEDPESHPNGDPHCGEDRKEIGRAQVHPPTMSRFIPCSGMAGFQNPATLYRMYVA